MTGLERGIASVLRDHAEGEVNVTALLDGARSKGRWRARRRRRLRMAGAGAAAVVLLGGLGLGVEHHRPPVPGPVVGRPVPPTAWPDLPRPPVAAPPAVPALGHPSVVGSDPGLLHLDLTGLPEPVTVAQWDSFERWERLSVQAGGRQIQVEIGPDAAALDPLTGPGRGTQVGGLPATLTTAGEGDFVQLRWQPESGLWAEVNVGGGEAVALQVAANLRLDRVYRCAVPFRLGPVPAGTQVQTCRLLVDGAGTSASATVGTGSWKLTVGIQHGPVNANSTVGGRPAQIQEYPGDGGEELFQVDVDLGDHVVDATAEGGYDRAAILRAITSYREVAPYDRPAAWTGGPLDRVPGGASDGRSGGPPG